ncbi:response regulator [Dehalobacter sp. DCM]|uniref:response regulator n=1 Tax=Dehalobacter sp. DCM TaxID=2907827 RepID=UPI00308129D9|nr:response regulator [Dehalobacter sp. DCM]
MAKILIVDDSAILRRKLAAIIRNCGHEVIGEASNGLQAMVEYENSRPDLVTMDINMPLTDGIEALSMILRRHPEAKIIMISDVNQKSMVFEAIKLGAKNYIIKPFEEEKIITIVNNVLRNK